MALNEECGVVGVIGHPEAANLIYLSLYALQHRGQEGSGIVTIDSRGAFRSRKKFGLVRDAFNREDIAQLEGASGVGHNRYSTCGGKLLQNLQPFTFRTSIGEIAIVQNGNLTNAEEIRKSLEEEGAIFQSTSDTEVFTHLIARAKSDSFLERLAQSMRQVRGAYALVVLTKNRMFAIRDPYGFRPLIIGRKGEAVVAVSETCALNLIGAEFEREVLPGEIIEVFPDGFIKSHSLLEQKKPGFCSFEPIYFARPDSRVFGRQIYDLRKMMGTVLAEESGVDADVVIAVPDSGVPMACGYAEAAGIPFELGLVRNHYIGRTFIEPSQSIRDFGVKLKLNPVESVIAGRRVVVVDDSLVRGTTSVKILRMIRDAGAKEVHFRLGSPPITHSCYFGVDTPARDRLLAAQRSVDEIREFIGADSLAFLSENGLQRVLGAEKDSYCYGCFSGNYPEEIGVELSQEPTDLTGGPGYVSFRA